MLQNNSFILLDAARMGKEIESAKSFNFAFKSLYYGRNEEFLSMAIPYLFTFHSDTEFGIFFMQKGWGASWGALVYSGEEMTVLVKHFCQLLRRKSEDGEDLIFRFYDPRVLRIFLPTCDKDQLKQFFGPVEYYICEDEDPAFGTVFSLQDEQLKQERISKEMVINFEPEVNKRRFSIF